MSRHSLLVGKKKIKWFITPASLLVIGLGVANYYFLPIEDHSYHKSPDRDDQSITIAILGDFGTGDFRQRRVSNLLESACRTFDIDFVQTVGDNFYPSGVQSITDPKWKTHFESMYSTPCLMGVNFFGALGNHDYESNPQSQIDYTSRGSERWFLPNNYYSHSHGTIKNSNKKLLTTVVLDTEFPIEKQKKFIENELALSESLWKIVIGHANIRTFGQKYINDDRHEKLLLPTLKDTSTDFYISGHTHSLQLIESKGEPIYVISGSGGKTPRAITKENNTDLIFGAEHLGFALITLTKTDATVRFIMTSSRLFDKDIEKEIAYKINRYCLNESRRKSCVKKIIE